MTEQNIPLRIPLTKGDTNALLPPSNNYTSRLHAVPDAKRSDSYLTLSLRAQSIGEKLALLEHLYVDAESDAKAGADVDASLFGEDLCLFRNELKALIRDSSQEKKHLCDFYNAMKTLNSELEAKNTLLQKKCECLNEQQEVMEKRENQLQDQYSVLVDALTMIANKGKLVKE